MPVRPHIINCLLISALTVSGQTTANAVDTAPGNSQTTEQSSSVSQNPDADANDQNRHSVSLRPISQKDQQNNKDTANAVNRIPGVHLERKDLQPPAQEAPIRGFHPIKKMLQPVVRLEKNSVELEQQIMKLEGPIAALQPAMLSLHKKMGTVEQKMENMQGRIGQVGGQIEGIGGRVDNVGSEMKVISGQMTGVRGDITEVRKDIGLLNGPIKDLHKPLAEVAQPLQTVDQKLEKLAALLTTVLFAILLAAGIIAVGTPIAAILIYKNRKRLFPDMSDREFPVAKADDSRQALHPTKT
jgi:chromosome segregation ATPase